MCDLPQFEDKAVLVGFDTADDAAVYQLDDQRAMIQTLDFFTPIVDDPYEFGQIAASNALSDVYAMGGQPKIALNIVGFPTCLETHILKDIMRGGADKVKEAGAVLVGGHSIDDAEPKYGLSVTGFVNLEDIWTNSGAQEGDVLFLTKPLGSGILTTGVKEDLVSPQDMEQLILTMKTLNKYAFEAIKDSGVTVHACTDITGFGLLGHCLEMAEGSKVTIEMDYQKVPILEGTLDLAAMGIVPAGAYRNRAHVSDKIHNLESVPEAIQDTLFDPQTSGGLLISVHEEEAKILEPFLSKNLKLPFAMIGRVKKQGSKSLVIKDV